MLNIQKILVIYRQSCNLGDSMAKRMANGVVISVYDSSWRLRRNLLENGENNVENNLVSSISRSIMYMRDCRMARKRVRLCG